MEQVAQADPFITQDSYRLICGDCLTVLPALEAGTVDVVVTSPPYNLGLSYRDYCDRRNEDEYLDWLIRVASEIRRVMKADASFFLNISGSSSAPWLPFELVVRLRPVAWLQPRDNTLEGVYLTRLDQKGHRLGQPFRHDRDQQHRQACGDKHRLPTVPLD